MSKRKRVVYLCKGKVFNTFVIIIAFAVFMGANNEVVFAKTEISAKAYIVMDFASGKILDSKNKDMKMPIASTTKIMTSLIALEQPEIDEPFEVDSNVIKVEGTSMGLQQYDKVTLRDLTKGMLLASGNDAANAVAYKIAGSNENFAKLMNEKAMKIGMKNTNFVTPSGLDSPEHYSTAYDMALLAATALNNEAFAGICKSQNMTVSLNDKNRKLSLKNHNRLLKDYEGCIGVKTGFTKKAGRCLVSAARRGEVTLICVTLSDADDWKDHKALLDEGFSKQSVNNINVSTNSINIKVVGGEKKTVKYSVDKNICTTMTHEELSQCEKRVIADKFYYAPIYKNQYLGEIQYIRNGIKVASVPIIAKETVDIKQTYKEQTNYWEKLKSLFK